MANIISHAYSQDDQLAPTPTMFHQKLRTNDVELHTSPLYIKNLLASLSNFRQDIACVMYVSQLVCFYALLIYSTLLQIIHYLHGLNLVDRSFMLLLLSFELTQMKIASDVTDLAANFCISIGDYSVACQDTGHFFPVNH